MQEPQGAAALAAVHRAEHGAEMPQSLHKGVGGTGFHPGAELPGSGQRGRDILAELEIFNVRGALGQRGAEHGPVGHALAGRCGHRAADAGGGRYSYKHGFTFLPLSAGPTALRVAKL